MALTPFFGRNNRNGNIWDPFSAFNGSIFDAMEPSSIFDRPFFGRDFNGMSGTRVDWVETADAHVFKADIPAQSTLNFGKLGNMNSGGKIGFQGSPSSRTVVWSPNGPVVRSPSRAVVVETTLAKNPFGLPGERRMKKEEVKVEVVDGRTLSISGERSQENIQEKDSWRCVERSHGKFSRQFGLPENAKVGEVAAKVENGVLTVTVPKTQSAAPRVRSIEIAES